MIYRWTVPEDIEGDSDFRLKLTTDEPPTNHLSGRLRIGNASNNASPSSLMEVDRVNVYELSNSHTKSVALAGLLFMLFAAWVVLRLRRKSERIVLE